MESIDLCVNVEKSEVVSDNNTKGVYQYVAYKRDYYDVESWEIVGWDEDCWTYTDKDGNDYESCSSYPIYGWVPAGSTSHRYRIDMPYKITASIGNTTITPATGNHKAGRKELTWKTTGITSSTLNNFTLTVTAPSGQKWTATDTCTVFLPRGLELSNIAFMDDYVYRNNKQTAFVRITNTRDVGEEKVTLKYKLNGSTVKTETLILPSGPTGSNKNYLRAFEYTPTGSTANLSVEASAPGLPRAYTTETTRTITANKSRSASIEPVFVATDIPVLTSRKRTNQTLQISYHHTTAAQNNTYNNGKIMPAVKYNAYTWTATNRNYNESLNVSVIIDSWQGTEGKGRGAWEIIPKFGAEASRTVRAGTGFELKVNTQYQTNFDSNPPNLRTATNVDAVNYTNVSAGLGLSPEGITRTWSVYPYANLVKSVDPNDNRNYIIGNTGLAHGETVEMQNTQGQKGSHSIRWELPHFVSTSVVGDTYSARIHHIDKFYKDAYILNGTQYGDGQLYRFYVISDVAGISNLLNVHNDYVNVFGVIFDDIWQTRPK